MGEIEAFQEAHPSTPSYWRSIVLFGKNTATYKFALAESLLDVAAQGRDTISLPELAVPYARHMCEHLERRPRQATGNAGAFITSCVEYNSGAIDQGALVDRTARAGFRYVLDAFHKVNGHDVPDRFFEKTASGIVLTDETFRLLESPQAPALALETEARWDLVETAWNVGIPTSALAIEYDSLGGDFYVEPSPVRRTPIAKTRDALNGYQKGKCFYCFDDISIDPGSEDLCDVDHFFPFALGQYMPDVPINGVWNLVLANKRCNRGENGKFDRIPTLEYLERLSRRNEFLISSHHPLRETIMRQTGFTPQDRRRFLQRTYTRARDLIGYQWKTKAVGPEAF
ncbi:MAG: HNH endonuclease domain-containing protein [Olegusella sp.]|nr:HNH endonuclease domain-containing protein [Olegusella sp.]